MAEIIAAIKESDVIIESFPLYFYGMPSQLKAVTDRCLALAEPYMGTRSDDGQTFNKMRDPSIFEKKFVIISSCGYVELEPVYPALLAQYDLICGGRDRYTAILWVRNTAPTVLSSIPRRSGNYRSRSCHLKDLLRLQAPT